MTHAAAEELEDGELEGPCRDVIIRQEASGPTETTPQIEDLATRRAFIQYPVEAIGNSTAYLQGFRNSYSPVSRFYL